MRTEALERTFTTFNVVLAKTRKDRRRLCSIFLAQHVPSTSNGYFSVLFILQKSENEYLSFETLGPGV